MNDALLRSSLLDLFSALGNSAFGVLIGGGYGLYLKQLHLAATSQRTLVNADLWPAPRATQDLDLFLTAELIADVQSMVAIRAALDRLGYQAIRGAEYLQFCRTTSATEQVKIDLLTTQLDALGAYPSIQADNRRARPIAADRPKLHAHPTDGALALTEKPLQIEVAGKLSTGQTTSYLVNIPNSFSYLMMKLTAYRDRRNDEDKDLGRHHALDIFRIIAMLTEVERDQLHEYMRRYSDNPQIQSCVGLIQSDFLQPTSNGVLAMRQHSLWQNDQQLDVFIEVIHDLGQSSMP